MNIAQIETLFADTAYIRTGGSPEELQCAQYLQGRCKALGLEARLEAFPVEMAAIQEARLTVDGKEIPCKGYLCSGNADLEAPLYYLPNASDKYALSQCRGKIVLLEGVSYWPFHDLVEAGALGFIGCDGNANYTDCDIDQKELRAYVRGDLDKLPGVCINVKDAIALVRDGAETAHIVLRQEETMGTSHNVVLDLPGALDEYIVLSAHYDSTSLSQGAYDNMSGSGGLLGIAEHFSKSPHRYGLRFVWCGSEERGLLGSKAYTAAHEAELKQAVLNINLDMIGCIVGKFFACCTAEEKLVHYLEYFSDELGFAMQVCQDVYSSDSTPFADHGVPAVSFARLAPQNAATIHNRYDTAAVMSPRQLLQDIGFLNAFVGRMANAARCPVGREIPENMKEKLDVYLNRKRGK